MIICGQRGIRTLDTGKTPYAGLANRCLQPLGHLSMSVHGAGVAALERGQVEALFLRQEHHLRQSVTEEFAAGGFPRHLRRCPGLRRS